MLRYVLIMMWLTLTASCREPPLRLDDGPCFSEWSESPQDFPDVGDFIIIYIIDSNMVMINNSNPLSTNFVINNLVADKEKIEDFPIRVVARDCNQARELNVKMKHSGLCLRNSCLSARKWNFPS